MPTTMVDTDQHAPSPLLDALARALKRAGEFNRVLDLSPMADTGLAHRHVWIHHADGDRVARIPKQSQMGMAVEDNLAYQAACFTRAADGGNTPAFHGVLPPDDDLPRGALLVEAIEGRPAHLPDDLPAIARTLASLHRLPLPAAGEQAPLLAPADPWQAMRDEVFGQAEALPEAGLAPEARALIEAQLQALPARLPDADRMTALISFDAHPGNFLIDATGRAVQVDLEKCRYGLPGFDLAHASLYTSTTWDPLSRAILDASQLMDFHAEWLCAMGPAGDDHPDTALLACRRAMWLWSLTWCAKWRRSHRQAPDAARSGEDWSSALSEDRLVAHVRERVEHYLAPATLRRVIEEFDALMSATHCKGRP
ncbi:aminoglycoside phosphotransferase family protein [Halomonas sp. THAF12]|uniref:aminoglycoside phosphotransferase family protein n=1 Tax=Halomonas sp. B23F22_10 TaxID=3459515 RepID=UPI00373FB08D